MKAFYKLALLSFLGILIAIFYIFYNGQSQQSKTTEIAKVSSPYPAFINAIGVVEAKSTNIPIGSAVKGVVSKVFVQTGQKVRVGDPLFSIDTAKVKEKIELAKAKIKVAQTTLNKVQHQYDIDKALHDEAPGVLSKRKYQASVDDMSLAKANYALANAELVALNKELERHTVISPMNGVILQCKIRAGEFVDSSRMTARAIIIGSDELRLRVDINENELIRFMPQTAAIALIRNQPELKIPLQYEYTDPYIVPKTNLSGLSTERTDLRVLQVLYTFNTPDFPLYVGQQLDVFIEVSKQDKM